MLDEWGGTLPAPGLRHPEGLDIGPDGRIYVAERGNHRVSIWTLSGALVATWGSRGSGPGSFEAPEDVALDAARGRLYVADTGNARILVLDAATGGSLGTWTDVGVPRGVAVAADGTVFVADASAHRIVRRAPDGADLGALGGGADGRPSSEPGRLHTPLGLSVDAAGTLYVADHGNQRVQWFDAAGAPAGVLDLQNAGAGGAPFDAAVDAAGTLHVAVERGILRFGGGRATAERSTLPPLREVFVPGETRCGMQTIEPEIDHHEGVRRLALRPGVGLAFTYAPQLRILDRIVTHPERGFEDVIPSLVCGDVTISSRHLYDPYRVTIGEGAHHLVALDRSDDLRVLRADGAWFDPLQRWPSGGRMDVATDRSIPYHVIALGGNRAAVSSLACFLGCGPERVQILEPADRTRRDRIGDRIPDAGWWNTAVAVDTNIATLNTGYGQLILRAGFPCGAASVALPCTDRSCNARQSCDPAPIRPVIGIVPLGSAREAFRSYRDLAYDSRGRLWVMARDGTLRAIDRFGRDAGSVALGGLGLQAAEALTVDLDGSFFVLTSDERIHKFAADGSPLAEWGVEEEAGPGRYLDVAVDDAGIVHVPDADGDRIVRFALGAPPGGEPIPPNPGACALEVDKRAEPSRLLLGETTEITLEVDPSCADGTAGLDIVLVFDGSCQMTGRRLANARTAGLRLLDELALDGERVAVVGFNDVLGGARLLHGLTDDRTALEATLSGLRNECLPPFLAPDRGAEGRISDGLRAGREALQGPLGRPTAGKALVLFSPSIFDQAAIFAGEDSPGGPPASDREHTLWEAHRLWSLGARIYAFGVDAEVATFPDADASVGAGVDVGADIPAPALEGAGVAADGARPDQRPSATPPPTSTGFPTPLTPTVIRPDATPTSTPDLRASHPADRGLLASIVRPPEGYRHTSESSGLPELYAELGRALAAPPITRRLVVEDEIPADMRLVPGSVSPPAVMPSPNTLRWTFEALGPEGPPAIRYRLEPLAAGHRPTNVRADARLIDSTGRETLATFPIPVVEVLPPTPTPAATVEPTSTPRPVLVTPTEGASATPSPTPTTRPTRRPVVLRPLYLPWVERDVCIPAIKPVDVAVLIDSSSSMNGGKIDAAREAARTFVGLLALPRDRAAILTFDEQARRLQDLTGRRDLLEAALDRVVTAVGTRIDRGLWEAVETVAGAERRIEADPIVVLLTDGQTEGGSEEDMFLIARLAADVGVTIYAIGLGSDVSAPALERITGAADRVYLAPSASEVAGIYERIARAIPCR